MGPCNVTPSLPEQCRTVLCPIRRRVNYGVSQGANAYRMTTKTLFDKKKHLSNLIPSISISDVPVSNATKKQTQQCHSQVSQAFIVFLHGKPRGKLSVLHVSLFPLRNTTLSIASHSTNSFFVTSYCI